MIGIFFCAIKIALVQTILAIETSVPEASVALWSDGECLFKAEFVSDRHHNSMVFNPLAEALEALEALEGRELTSVVVGTGPGSYSGTRVGIAAAQGVAIARGCPAIGLGSMAATPVARDSMDPNSSNSPKNSGGALAVGDARRGLYFISPISATGEAMDVELMDAEAFASRMNAVPDAALFTLDDPSSLGLEQDLENRVQRTRPEARLLIDVWMSLDPERQQVLANRPLSPTYLRAPFTSKAKSGHPLLRKG